MLAESIPIYRPSDPPRFKNLMEDYVSRCTGDKSVKFVRLDTCCESAMNDVDELHYCRFIKEDIKGNSSGIGWAFGYVRR